MSPALSQMDLWVPVQVRLVHLTVSPVSHTYRKIGTANDSALHSKGVKRQELSSSSAPSSMLLRPRVKLLQFDNSFLSQYCLVSRIALRIQRSVMRSFFSAMPICHRSSFGNIVCKSAFFTSLPSTARKWQMFCFISWEIPVNFAWHVVFPLSRARGARFPKPIEDWTPLSNCHNKQP